MQSTKLVQGSEKSGDVFHFLRFSEESAATVVLIFLQRLVERLLQYSSLLKTKA